MTITSNAHTHSTFCDGHNTPREMAQRALDLGFTDLGFSSHALELPGGDFGMKDEEGYRAEIGRLKEKYRGRLGILMGAEQDYYTPDRYDGYDYVVGSTHYFPEKDGRYYSADSSREEVLKTKNEGYGGDWRAMVRDFYALSVENVRRYKPDIVGHFDLIKKFNTDGALFDEASPEYRRMALEAIDEVARLVEPCGGMVELNTAALLRGHAYPYPAPFLLEHLAQRGTRVIVSSDSHKCETLNYAFERAPDLLRAAGFTTVALLREGVFQDVPLDE